MGSNRDYNSIGDNLVLNTYAEDIYIYSGRTVGRGKLYVYVLALNQI